MTEMIALLVGLGVGALVRYDQVRRLREENHYAQYGIERIDQALEAKELWRHHAKRLWARLLP